MASNPQSVRLLEADPELGADLPPARRECARAAIAVSVTHLFPGAWTPRTTPAAAPDQPGMLVLEGALIRDVLIAGRAGAEVVGQGDLIRVSHHHLGIDAPVPSHVEWHVLTPATVALIDRRIVVACAPYPEVLAALAARAVLRAQALAVVLAISHVPGVKRRLLLLLWHLADRFGRVGDHAVALPLPVTHRMLSRIVGASRPSVSTAMRELEEEARVAKCGDGGFELLGEPPQLERASAGAWH